ncbi:ATP-binding protein [Patescibacteria group bacterium]|nr:ATP-binding protein [Patescibacteria group bacterium]
MIATNKTFEQWTDIFTDGVLAGAIADRVVHYSTIIMIKEPSYRTKNLKKVADKKLVSQGI